MNVLLSTAYWPNLRYWHYVLNSQNVLLEQHEHYEKQSYRNRTQILAANGVLELNIPIERNRQAAIKNVRISYSEKWQVNHWRAITSAYRNSPYFEYFEPFVAGFYTSEFEFLHQFNTNQLYTILKILKIKKDVQFTTSYAPTVSGNWLDLRQNIHPKRNSPDPRTDHLLSKPYYQTFQDKFAFAPNLSILDLLFNKGLTSLDYLRN